MNKKILISLTVIGVVAAIAIGGTIAYFNDTETSSGNIFTAGSIDLKVDHLAQTYNGEDCETCSLTLYSGDGGAQVVGGINTMITSFPFQAALVVPTSITTQYWVTHPTAGWIWASPATLVGDDGTNGNVTYTFEHKFNWWGDAVDVNLVFDVAADNQYEILLNGTPIAAGTGSAQYTTLDPVAQGAFLAEVDPGENTLTFIVTNLTQDNPAYNTPLNNPGGLLYYLTVTRNPEDCDENSDFQQACHLWTEKDLDEGDTFFTFGDVKPADYGTNLISLHVNDNDAWICLLVDTTADNDNGLVDPEETAGDTTGGDDEGELDNYLNVALWDDEDKDGIHDVGEAILYSGLLANADMAIAEGGDTPVPGGETIYVGLAWCAGEITADTNTAEITCDGSTMLDDSQTDSLMATLTAYAEQSRNNDEFECANVGVEN